MNSIQFIYFDVGGVVVLDFSKTNKWVEMLHDLGIPANIKSEFLKLFKEHETKICRGENINIFIKEAEKQFNFKFPPNYNMTEDFVNRFEINPPMLHLVNKLKNDFKIGLLTAQYPGMLDLIFQKGLIPQIKWDVIIDSSVEKITKPSLEIYLLAEQKASVPPGSILFVDNNAELLKLPKQRGWKVFEYNPSNVKESTESLERFLNI